MLDAGEVERSKSVSLCLLAGIAWCTWKTKNDWVFNKKLIKSPKIIAYKIVGVLKQWKKMLKEKDQGLMGDAILKLQEGLRAW